MKYCGLVFALLLAGCGTVDGDDIDAVSCTVSKEGTVATITCPDGTKTTISDGTDGTSGIDGTDGTDGIDGTNGTTGQNGSNGHSIVYSTISATHQQCPKGGALITLAIDLNDNGVLDSSDGNLTYLKICNSKKPKDH